MVNIHKYYVDICNKYYNWQKFLMIQRKKENKTKKKREVDEIESEDTYDT